MLILVRARASRSERSIYDRLKIFRIWESMRRGMDRLSWLLLLLPLCSICRAFILPAQAQSEIWAVSQAATERAAPAASSTVHRTAAPLRLRARLYDGEDVRI